MMRRAKPIPQIPGRPIPKIRKRKVKTQVIDPVNPRAPKGKLNKGAAEPMDTKTRVPAGQNKRSGLAGMLKKRKPTKESPNTQSPGGGTIPGVFKGPGFKEGGAVNKRKATGAAKRGFGKAYMKGRR